MVLDIGSLMFNMETQKRGGTPSWGTDMGQGEGYKFNFENQNSIITSLTYCCVDDRENVSFSFGKGGSRTDDYRIVLASLYKKVFVNNVLIKGAEFILLVAKQIQNPLGYHIGRRTLKYSPNIVYRDKKINENCFNLIKEQFKMNDNSAWFIDEINMKNQDELHFKMYIVDKDKSVEYADSEERKKAVFLKRKEKELIQKYDKDDFLKDIFMDEKKYETIVSLLNRKKNIILEGAPGVGKTFIAKRLAYSILGKKDDSQIEFIQFHQNYSYEEFVEGYRPTEDNFKLKKGIFYNFCKKAELNQKEKYFLIIDEINRGNISKIFGELLMLIECDKRGSSLRMEYSEELFSIPENLYIIGLMNTADRSLALIDYALRRRFSFLTINPAFTDIESESNRKFLEKYHSIFGNNNDEIIELMRSLNEDIKNDPALGKGFMIGHSYFCSNIKEGKATDLTEIVKYEIIPLLEEYWYDDEDKKNEWIQKFKDLGLEV